MANVLWSILWVLVLIFAAWWLAEIVAWLYILLIPFVACVPALSGLTDLLLKAIQWPGTVGHYIKDGKEGCGGVAEDAATS